MPSLRAALVLSLIATVRLAADSLPVVFPGDPSHLDSLKTRTANESLHLSVRDLARVLGAGIFENAERNKIVLYVGKHRIKISAYTSFVLVDDRVFQFPTMALYDGQDFFLPATPFLAVLREAGSVPIELDAQRQRIVISLVSYSIAALALEEKANGTVARFRTTREFPEADVTGWMAADGWFYLTIVGATADTAAIASASPAGIATAVSALHVGNSLQIGLQVAAAVESHEIYQSSSELVLTLRTPLAVAADRIRMIRDQWFLDMVVLDAGHGGKDSGTVGPYGLEEKFVTLDIARRVGNLLENHTAMKVLYSRDEDVFVPLWKRTRLANESKGKIFVSIHGNANPNHDVRGFETYILRPGKTEDAVEVAARENEVVKLEEQSSRYDNLTEDNFIVASLAQNSFMKESESLAAIIQEEMRKTLPSPDRGVKQAGFFVLVGASMPNALVEVGFLSNPHEEKQLRKPGYRQSIAEAIYQGIRRFKDKHEQALVSEAGG